MPNRAMRAVVLALVLITAGLVVPATSVGAASTLSGDGTLYAGQALVSPNGSHRLVMQGDGNLVLYRGAAALFSTETGGNPGARAVMQRDGNLVVYSRTGWPLWNSGPVETGGPRLVVQDDGNAVIYTAYGIPVWSVWTRRTGYSASTIGIGYSLRVGQRLVAPDGVHFASMQSDGNFVVYRGSTALWSTRTFGPNHRVVLQADGNLVLYSATGRALWNSRSVGTGGSRLRMQTDGNLVVYRNTYPATWSWRTGPIALGPIGDDYPYRSAPAGQLDPWGFRVRSAESFVAWRLNSVNKVPFRSSTGGRTWGAPNSWDETADALGYLTFGASARGLVAQTDQGPRGHVAWVADRHADGTVTVEEYDQAGTGTYSVRRVFSIAFRFIRIPSG